MSEQELEANVQFASQQMQFVPKKSTEYKIAKSIRLYCLKQLVKLDEQRMYLTI